VFGFLIPVVSAGLKMRRKIREMQNQANSFNQKDQRNFSTTENTPQEKPKPSQSDYIEFEEIK
jgi:hypothetical protein